MTGPAYYFISLFDGETFDIIREDFKGNQRIGVIIASSVGYHWPSGKQDYFYNDDWVNAKRLLLEDFPLYISSLKYVTPEFEQLMKGLK